jgi:hypothetical protein
LWMRMLEPFVAVHSSLQILFWQVLILMQFKKCHLLTTVILNSFPHRCTVIFNFFWGGIWGCETILGGSCSFFLHFYNKYFQLFWGNTWVWIHWFQALIQMNGAWKNGLHSERVELRTLGHVSSAFTTSPGSLP